APATVLAIAVLWIGFAATGLATPWLHLAAFLPTTVAGLAAIAFWPVFATDRSLGELVRRLTRRPLHGMPTAALGAILAAACCLALVAFAASPMCHCRGRTTDSPRQIGRCSTTTAPS
ncbi:MAG: hypothetical protein ABL997_14985, partial [Planctomycetota bacterium]